MGDRDDRLGVVKRAVSEAVHRRMRGEPPLEQQSSVWQGIADELLEPLHLRAVNVVLNTTIHEDNFEPWVDEEVSLDIEPLDEVGAVFLEALTTHRNLVGQMLRLVGAEHTRILMRYYERDEAPATMTIDLRGDRWWVSQPLPNGDHIEFGRS